MSRGASKAVCLSHKLPGETDAGVPGYTAESRRATPKVPITHMDGGAVRGTLTPPFWNLLPLPLPSSGRSSLRCCITTARPPSPREGPQGHTSTRSPQSASQKGAWLASGPESVQVQTTVGPASRALERVCAQLSWEVLSSLAE